MEKKIMFFTFQSILFSSNKKPLLFGILFTDRVLSPPLRWHTHTHTHTHTPSHTHTHIYRTARTHISTHNPIERTQSKRPGAWEKEEYLSIYPYIYLYINLSIYLPIYPSYLFIYIYIYLSIHLFSHLLN